MLATRQPDVAPCTILYLSQACLLYFATNTPPCREPQIPYPGQAPPSANDLQRTLLNVATTQELENAAAAHTTTPKEKAVNAAPQPKEEVVDAAPQSKDKWRILLLGTLKKWVPLMMTIPLNCSLVTSLQLKKWGASILLCRSLLRNHLLLRPLPQFCTNTVMLALLLIPTGYSLTVGLPSTCSPMERSSRTSTLPQIARGLL